MTGQLINRTRSTKNWSRIGSLRSFLDLHWSFFGLNSKGSINLKIFGSNFLEVGENCP